MNVNLKKSEVAQTGFPNQPKWIRLQTRTNRPESHNKFGRGETSKPNLLENVWPVTQNINGPHRKLQPPGGLQISADEYSLAALRSRTISTSFSHFILLSPLPWTSANFPIINFLLGVCGGLLACMKFYVFILQDQSRWWEFQIIPRRLRDLAEHLF